MRRSILWWVSTVLVCALSDLVCVLLFVGEAIGEVAPLLLVVYVLIEVFCTKR